MDDNNRFFPGHLPSTRPIPEKLFESLRRDAVTALSGVLAGFWGDVEEQVRLAAIANPDSRAAFDDRLSIQLLSQRALELAGRYRESVEQAFDRWRNPRPRAIENKSLSLMSEAQLEIHLAGQQVTDLLDHQFLHPLYQLHERLDALANSLNLPKQSPETNPLRPEVPVLAFVKLFKEDDLTPELRRLIFLQLEKRLSKVLGELYPKAIASLEKGLLARAIPQQRPAAHASQEEDLGWVPDGGLVDPRMQQVPTPPMPWGMGPAAMPGNLLSGPITRPPRYREAVHQQLRAWRQSMLSSGSPSHSPAAYSAFSRMSSMHGASGGYILAPQELFGIASMIQNNDPAPYVRALAGDDHRPLPVVIRDQLANGSRQLGYDPNNTRFNEFDEDAIDLVGILLQTLARSHASLQRARALYGRLVVPYLKLALSDDSLFDQRNHPGRRLLEALSEACDGNIGESPQDQQTLTHAELAVGRVVEEYQDDQAIFELAASELRDHLDQQRRMREIAEQRAAEAVCGRERLQHARRAVDELVSGRLAERPLTTGIAEFLSGHWRHFLVQTWLREGPTSAQYISAVAVGDSLIQADADAAHAYGAKVADRILELQGPLGRCYASCGLDATSARDSLARIVTALAFPDQPRSVRTLSVEEHVEAADATNWGGLRVVGGTDTLEYDLAEAARMRRLRVGQSLRLVEDDGRETAGRIAWVSPLTSRFLIVNRRGLRKLVVSPEELTVLVAKGRVILRSSDAPFDEAMRDMWQQFTHPRTAVS